MPQVRGEKARRRGWTEREFRPQIMRCALITRGAQILSRQFQMLAIGFPRTPDEPVPGFPDESSAALDAGAPSRLVPKEEASFAPTVSCLL